MPAITAKEIVAASPRKKHLHALRSGLLTDGLGGKRGGVWRGLIERPDQGVEILDGLLLQGGHMQGGAEVTAHAPRIGEVVRKTFGLQTRGIRRADGVAGIALGGTE